MKSDRSNAVGILIVLLATGLLFGGMILDIRMMRPPTYPAQTRKAASSGAPGAATASAPAPQLPTEELIAHGKEKYDVFCAACHQPGGVGKVGFAPYLRNRDFLAIASDDFIRTTIKSGRPGTAMTPWAMLEPVDVDGIIAYLRSLPVENPVAIHVDPTKKYPGDPEAGHKSYDAFCASCHGPEGQGYAAGGSGPAIGLLGFLAVASDEYIFQTLKQGRVGTPMRGFIGAKGLANLTPEDAGNIIAYLRELGSKAPAELAAASPETGGAGDPKTGKMHFDANCAACHQPEGVGKVGFAPSIRNRDFLALSSDEFIRHTIRNGRPGTAMVQRPDLPDQTVNDIIAYLRSLPMADRPPVLVDSSAVYHGDAAAGQNKFATYCAACHGPEGAGYAAGGSGPAIGLAGFLSTASDDYILKTVQTGRIGTAMKPFIGAKGVANLTEEDVKDVIAYLRTLQ